MYHPNNKFLMLKSASSQLVLLEYNWQKVIAKLINSLLLILKMLRNKDSSNGALEVINQDFKQIRNISF